MKNKKWKTLSSKKVFDHKYFKVRKDIVRLPDGRQIEWFYWDISDSAMVAALTKEGKLVTVKQYRYLPDQEALELPSGGGGRSEEMPKCAERELEEETGYRCEKLVKLGSFYETMAQLNRQVHIFLGENATKLSRPVRKSDENEETEVVLVDPEKAVKLAVEGKIISMGSSLAIMLLKDHLKG